MRRRKPSEVSTVRWPPPFVANSKMMVGTLRAFAVTGGGEARMAAKVRAANAPKPTRLSDTLFGAEALATTMGGGGEGLKNGNGLKSALVEATSEEVSLVGSAPSLESEGVTAAASLAGVAATAEPAVAIEEPTALPADALDEPAPASTLLATEPA